MPPRLPREKAAAAPIAVHGCEGGDTAAAARPSYAAFDAYVSAHMRDVRVSCTNMAERAAVFRYELGSEDVTVDELTAAIANNPDRAGLGGRLLGQRVNVRWQHNQWFKGTITCLTVVCCRTVLRRTRDDVGEVLDSCTLHTVLYDDGDMRTYYLPFKTWRLLDLNVRWGNPHPRSTRQEQQIQDVRYAGSLTHVTPVLQWAIDATRPWVRCGGHFALPVTRIYFDAGLQLTHHGAEGDVMQCEICHNVTRTAVPIVFGPLYAPSVDSDATEDGGEAENSDGSTTENGNGGFDPDRPAGSA